jgi:hypothetical protein
MTENKLTKQDIIKWYNTSILPSCGTEELNIFMYDISRVYDAFSIYILMVSRLVQYIKV